MVSQKTNLSASNIKYLLAMRELNVEPRGVRSTDLAKAIGVTKPSVYTMAKSLQTLGLVKKDRYGAIRFTDDGYKLSERYGAYCDAVCGRLCDIFPESADIKAAACAILAELPETDVAQLCSNIGHSA